uniref:Caspase-8 n=1 Tax=Leptobrachium leishanense TaxID=445787 RepID=A0A8C5Q3W9_9ANUR
MDEETTKLLCSIAGNLKPDLLNMIFLCGEDLVDREKENIKTVIQLFTILEQKLLIKAADLSYLKELLFHIRKLDILQNQLNTTEEDMIKYFSSGNSKISSYKKLLFTLSEKIDSLCFEDVKYILKLRTPTHDKAKNMLELFSGMEKSGNLNKCNLGCLKRAFNIIKRIDLHDIVENFEKEYQESQNELPSKYEKMSLEEPGQECPKTKITPQQEYGQMPLEVYELKCNPHGKCVIINNYNFKQARSLNRELADRGETDSDTETIKNVFNSRNYNTEEHNNLTGDDMLKIMKQYAEENHNDKDSFVCFILSCGGLEVTYGTDGCRVPIKNLTKCINNKHCKSLMGKPKIFFILLCRADVSQTTVCEARISSTEDETRSENGSLPVHSDFLTVYATMEDLVSTNNAKSGCGYIQELCAALNDSQFYDTPLQTIITNVHRKICVPDFNMKSELRKVLILPPPTQSNQLPE